MSTTTPQIHKGLAGVVVDRTAVSNVVPETNSLTYRGYAVQDLAASRSFEEVAHLIWHGELPTAAELADLTAAERSQRELSRSTISQLERLPDNCHPMDVLRSAVSAFGAEDPTEDEAATDALLAKALTMMARLPSVVALDFRRRHDRPRIAPDPSLGFSENFFHMCFGEVPEPEIVRAFDVSLILYAEHSFNASTFTARVVTSTLSDVYSAITAAIGALKGPLHGGANEAVMEMMLEIDDPALAAGWLRHALESKRKVMGFGHRVYKNGDSRVPTMAAAMRDVAARRDGGRWIAMYEALEAEMIALKGIHPNLDFPAGPAYHLMGFDIPMFTPIFVMSRITGWTAHIVEQNEANSLIRPLSLYAGLDQRPVPAGGAEDHRLTA